jgi:hypothetical protein
VRPGVGGGLLVAASFGGGVLIDPDGPTPQRIFSAGGDDAAFLDLGGDGALAGATAGGGPGDDEAGDMATASGGARWAVGHYIGPAAFGAGSDLGTGAALSLDSGTDGAGFLLRLLP